MTDGGVGERIALRGGRAVTLFATGLGIGDARTSRFVPYAELIHVVAGARGLRIGSQEGSLLLPRAAFTSAGDAETLARSLRERIGALPDGEARRRQLAALDARLARRVRPKLGPGLALLCVALQLGAAWRPELLFDGEYWRILALGPEPWRFVSGQLLHAGLAHLVLNALGLVALGGWLERQVGGARAGLVAFGAAAGAMAGCVVAGYDSVLGASGIASGLAGALIALELRRPDLLPAPLRLPRLLLIGAVFADAALLSLVPNVAHAAHAGGFVAGAVVALATAPSDATQFAPRAGLRVACGVAVALFAAALGAWGGAQLDPLAAARRRAAVLVEAERVPALLLNNDAWTIAVAEKPGEEDLELALRLARRAVRATLGRDPNFLDTLAEVYFQLGRSDEALEAIDQAIALAPGVVYFAEQRRRFLGERDRDDRPEPGDEPFGEPEPAPPFGPEPGGEGHGIRV